MKLSETVYLHASEDLLCIYRVNICQMQNEQNKLIEDNWKDESCHR